MSKKNKLVYGVGINNADYNVTERVSVDGKWKIVWVIGFTCCCRKISAIKHIGTNFGFTCCYNEGSPIAGEQSWIR